MSLLKKSMFINIFYKKRQLAMGSFLVLAVFIFLSVAVYFDLFALKPREASLLLSFEGIKGRMFVGKVNEGMTILDALIVSSDAGRIRLEYSVSADGKVIIYGLDGYDAGSSDKKMIFYLDQRRIDLEQIGSVLIGPGDNIEVRLE